MVMLWFKSEMSTQVSLLKAWSPANCTILGSAGQCDSQETRACP